MIEFQPFPKIARLRRDIVITEKIDGTNASVIISDDGSEIGAASRSQLIYPGKTTDNHGFAAWVEQNKEELLKLGPGRHFGEWWGSGIQRGYGLAKGEKRFSLFNVSRWGDAATRPHCCGVVPTLYAGPFSQAAIDIALDDLRANGSRVIDGFRRPEGIIVFHTASGGLFKITCEKDDQPKGAKAA